MERKIRGGKGGIVEKRQTGSKKWKDWKERRRKGDSQGEDEERKIKGRRRED